MKVRFDRWWNFPAAMILFAAFMMTALKIQSTKWTDDLYLVNWLTFIGFFLGLAIGYSQFKNFFSKTLLFLYSILIVPYSLGTIYQPSVPWLARYESIYGRITSIIDQFKNNVRIEDPILFLIFLAILVWITSLTCGYYLSRSSRPWIPILISGISIFTIEYFDQVGTNLYTAFFILFVLIFLSQFYFYESNRKWKFKGIPVDFETEPSIRRSAFILTFLFVFISWNAPNLVAIFQKDSQQQKQVIGFVKEIQIQFTKLTAPLQGTTFLRSEFFGETVSLGNGSELSDEVVLEISVDQAKPSGGRYYWRARTYNLFTDNQWSSSFDLSKSIEPNIQLSDLNEYLLFPLRTFYIKTQSNLGILYTPPNTQKINRPATAFFTPISEEESDYIAFTLEEIAFPGESYEVVNRIPTPTIAQMRNSTQEYPDWLKEYYLQLPTNFSPKISELALEITEGYTNPYDKTQAITDYLRKHITYSQIIPAPPNGSDPIEWFLFEHKSGFCNYYATSEVLMLRSIGIPARIVFGFAQGEPQNKDETEFLVRRKQSHAWPEVFFTGIGWVEFEPTTIQPTIDRLPGESIAPITDLPSVRDPNRIDTPIIDGGESSGIGGEVPAILDGDNNEDQIGINQEELIPEPKNQPIFPFVIMGLVVLISFYVISKDAKPKVKTSTPAIIETFIEKRGWKVPHWIKLWSSYVSISDEEKAFSKIIFSLWLFNKSSNFSSTPAELVKEFKTIFPEKSIEVDQMLIDYQKAIYSPHAIQIKNIQDSGNKIFAYSISKKIENFLKF